MHINKNEKMELFQVLIYGKSFFVILSYTTDYLSSLFVVWRTNVKLVLNILFINFLAASKVRLSELPNEGFIEIFDGSKWRKVDDKNWDKRKQTPLCQHLGYSDTMSNNNLQEISSGEIATGYLYCSGQQPSTQACSAYLYPSTLTNKATKIPYGKCMY